MRIPDLDETISLFSLYMRLTGVPRLDDETGPDPALAGKRLGIVNGSSWVTLWSVYFGRRLLPGVKLVNIGNEAIQLSFMRAHAAGAKTPPDSNIAAFARYSRDLADLTSIDALLLTCSTMNRSVSVVREEMTHYGIPVVQIDEAMMEEAVSHGGRALVIATHGPTVRNTQDLLRETSRQHDKSIDFEGATIEQAFELLGSGQITAHNELIARTIRERQAVSPIEQVILAQLSMSVFLLSFPDPERIFDVPVRMSGVSGFRKVGDLLRSQPPISRRKAGPEWVS